MIILVASDLYWIRFLSMVIGFQRQTEMNPILIVSNLTEIFYRLHSIKLISRLRGPSTIQAAVWPVVKKILESLCQMLDKLKDGNFPRKNRGQYLCHLQGMHIFLAD